MSGFDFSALWPAFVALVTGTAVGSLVGLVPGIGARMGVVLTLPLAAMFDPYSAAIYLFALHSVVNTSGSIPAIAFGVPTSGADAATVVDGYPLARMGRAGEALGASLSASAIGGVLGALAFLVAIPVARPLVTSFGPPEMMMLAFFGITMISALSSQGILAGLIVAATGALFAVVGQDFRTGEQRLTFGLVDLWGGFDLAALVCGLFVIPEMLSLKLKTSEAQERAMSTSIRDVYKGMFVTLRYNALVVRSTVFGILVGAAPAVGSTVGVWIAYAHAARTTKSEIPFGQGAIAGVIAPEAANNSKEGGAMIPTLLFGIPGSSSMAVMMAAMAYCGVAVGPNMLGKDIGLSYALVATVALANILAVPFFFATIPWLVRLSVLRMDAIAPLTIAASVTATMIADPTLMTLVQIGMAATLGLGLKRADWPRGPFVLGFVIQQMAENSTFQTIQIWGWSAFERPITLGLLLLTVAWILYSIRKNPPQRLNTPRVATLQAGIGLMVLFGLAIIFSLHLSTAAGLAPIAIAVCALALCAAAVMIAALSKNDGEATDPMQHILLTAAFIASIPVIGIFVATIAYVASVLTLHRFRLKHVFITTALMFVAQFALLTTVFDLRIEKELIGRVVWTILERLS